MITSNELRIGNWVILDWDGDKRPQIIAEINRTNFEVQDWDEQFDSFNLYPVPLTPEILEKCGYFYKPCGISGADMWQGMGLWGRKKGEPNQEVYFRGGFSRSVPISLKLVGWFNSNFEYLHQIQNIYYSLTGTELDIKLLK